MFYDLATVLSLAVLFIVMCGASAFCAGALWALVRILRLVSPRTGASLLFLVRVLPLLLALGVTLGLVLPSIFEYEPRFSGEVVSMRLLFLAALGGLIVIGIAARCLRVLWTTHRAQRQWRARSELLQTKGTKLPVYCSNEAGGPLLVVTGIFRPKIFVARKVRENLSANELSAAIAHEIAHVRSLDNLKQLILKVTQPPRWFNVFRRSDEAWLNASEMAADEGALANGASALDLSAALVKVGKLSRQVPMGAMIAVSHLLPAATESSIAMRVMHLEKLLSSESQGAAQYRGHGSHRTGLYLLLMGFSYVICLHAVLPWMHNVLELLVK